MIAAETILDVAARAYGVAPAALRDPDGPAAWEAREAFCYVARGLGADPADIGLAVGLSAEMAEDACEAIAARLNDGRDLDDRLGGIEIECRTLETLAERIGLRLPAAAHPFATARKLVRSERDAMSVPVADLMAVGAALIALAGSRPAPRAPIVAAAEQFDAARRMADDAAFTANEKAAARQRDAALKAFQTLIGA